MDFDFLKENPVMMAGIGLAGIALLANLGDIRDRQQYASALGHARDNLSRETAELRLSVEQQERRAAIANDRYEAGCIFVVLVADTGQAAAITEGASVIDLATRQPFSDGTVVCDSLGNTGVMGGGVVTQVAFTGDRSVVEMAMDRAGFDARETAPGRAD